jgi:hypothetical protein
MYRGILIYSYLKYVKQNGFISDIIEQRGFLQLSRAPYTARPHRTEEMAMEFYIACLYHITSLSPALSRVTKSGILS